MLALRDQNGIVASSVVGLADMAKVSIDECEEALRILMSPDPNDSSGVDDGIRIRKMIGGWQLVNNDLYRFSTEAKREFWKQQKAEYRQKVAGKKARREFAKNQNGVQQRGSSRQIRYEKAHRNGEEEKADSIAAEGIPKPQENITPLDTSLDSIPVGQPGEVTLVDSSEEDVESPL